MPMRWWLVGVSVVIASCESAPPELCTVESGCGAGEACVDNQCLVVCERDADCDAGFVCEREVCRETTSGGDAASGGDLDALGGDALAGDTSTLGGDERTGDPASGDPAVASGDEATCALGQSCDDGDPCTVDDACNAAGLCTGTREPTRLYYVLGPEIRRVRVDGCDDELVVTASDVSDIALDVDGDALYWVSSTEGALWRSSLAGAAPAPITSALDVPVCVAPAPADGVFFWASQGGARALNRSSLADGSGEVPIVPGLSSPRDCVFDATGQRVYYTDGGTPDVVAWASFDGAQGGDLVTTGLSSSTPLAFDGAADLVFFGDIGLLTIESVSTAGGARLPVQSGLARVAGLAVDPGTQKLYWSDAGMIRRCDYDGGNVEDFAPVGDAGSLAILE